MNELTALLMLEAFISILIGAAWLGIDNNQTQANANEDAIVFIVAHR
jgi:hypothetical protein